MTSKKVGLLIAVLLTICLSGKSQINFTANTFVPTYNESFNIGSNMGYYGANWKDEEIADLIIGNPEKNVEGLKCNSLRLSLPDKFIEKYKANYIIRQGAFEYYGQIGSKNNTLFVGGPSDNHKELTEYCPGKKPKIFANLYTPIWDNGENGTPINDNNYFAAYIYWIATKYSNIKYWEIINEPDFSYASGAYRGPGEKDNWWDNDPPPCTLINMYAPVESYIRMLRIAYEVIKYVDKSDFVCLGGIGYSSFVDAILRKTDNPNGGMVSSEYPLYGGAYFDCLSFHIYPMYSLRKWSNQVNGFVYFRHSDAAIESTINMKNRLSDLLGNYGYDGSKFPYKKFIITEANLPDMEFDELIGSTEAQRNYIMKAPIKCQMNGIDAFYPYNLSDSRPRDQIQGPFESMGFYLNISNQLPYKVTLKPSGIGYKNVANFLKSTYFDQAKTMEMSLGDEIDGGAFLHEDGSYIFVLWAKTSEDKNENAFINYKFPTAWGNTGSIIRYDWNYTENPDSSIFKYDDEIPLYAYPTFFKTDQELISKENKQTVTINKIVTPNGDGKNDFFEIKEIWKLNNATIRIYDTIGNLVFESLGYNNNWPPQSSDNTLLPNGAYYYIIEFHDDNTNQTGGIRILK